MDRVTGLFIQSVANFLQHADNITDGTVLILHSHIDNASVIRDSVESDMHLHASLAELLPDVIRETNVCPTLSRDGLYLSIELILSAIISFDVHAIASFSWMPAGGDGSVLGHR